MLLSKFIISSLFVGVTLAGQSAITLVSTKTLQKCRTSYSSKSVALPLPTTTVFTTKHLSACKGTSTVTPTSTITPSGSRSTVIQTVTITITNSAVTGTFATTSTYFVTQTNIVAITTASVVTLSFGKTISATETVLVPTSSGFLPAASATSQTYLARKLNGRKRNDATLPLSQNNNAKSYPKNVKCVDTVKYISTVIKIVTVSKTKSITLPVPTSVDKITNTITSTSTVVSSAVSITSSFSTTSTVFTVSTSFISAVALTVSSTSTLTVTVTSSVCAACTASSGNLLGPSTLNGYIQVYNGGGSGLVASTALTAYDCCVQCQVSITCLGTFYIGDACYRIQSDQCASQKRSSASYLTRTSPDSGDGFVVSNGNCGYIWYGFTVE